MAKQAAQMGYEVVGYGYGSVIVYSEKNDPEKLFELVDALGVCHPNISALQDRVSIGGIDTEAQE